VNFSSDMGAWSSIIKYLPARHSIVKKDSIHRDSTIQEHHPPPLSVDISLLFLREVQAAMLTPDSPIRGKVRTQQRRWRARRPSSQLSKSRRRQFLSHWQRYRWQSRYSTDPIPNLRRWASSSTRSSCSLVPWCLKTCWWWWSQERRPRRNSTRPAGRHRSEPGRRGSCRSRSGEHRTVHRGSRSRCQCKWRFGAGVGRRRCREFCKIVVVSLAALPSFRPMVCVEK
jgi:hypothetical protein